jgi:predicted  nucleic acid-binding Zn-ribbon protein
MPTRSNRLQKLADQFVALPLQQELKQIKIQLNTTTKKIQESSEVLDKALGQVSTLREMQEQPDLLRSEIDQKIKTLYAVLNTLEQQIKPQGVSTKLSAGLDSLAKVSKSISDQISQTSEDVDTDMLETTKTLIELTGKYDPTAKQSLQHFLSEFNKFRNPDGSDSVARYRAARENLLKARTALNIPGNVGKFLSESARGVGSIKTLLEPEIQSFLKEHPALLSQLTVKLS